MLWPQVWLLLTAWHSIGHSFQLDLDQLGVQCNLVPDDTAILKANRINKLYNFLFLAHLIQPPVWSSLGSSSWIGSGYNWPEVHKLSPEELFTWLGLELHFIDNFPWPGSTRWFGLLVPLAALHLGSWVRHSEMSPRLRSLFLQLSRDCFFLQLFFMNLDVLQCFTSLQWVLHGTFEPIGSLKFGAC